MDKEQEKRIVKRFFAKRIQDRVIFELSSEKKRVEALNRLCHNYGKTLLPEYMIEIPTPNSDYQEIATLLKKHGAPNHCYVISWNEEIDGKTLFLNEALKKVVGFGMPSIVSCIEGSLAYFEAEQEVGSPSRFLLKR
ncbi:hypothetical protein ABE28_024235 (plasmid) [Peribacillus muralis]|uniref:Uncharacterized protein n=1 Tax=Peribacillus muralis TaxID=264697 RepID=A0A1B3XW69_9BACI|nr:hypothetical protein [Peribacillus muralis]AOH57460.1 hypothetical protein ABE28_024235 [Peribacillus muralis]